MSIPDSTDANQSLVDSDTTEATARTLSENCPRMVYNEKNMNEQQGASRCFTQEVILKHMCKETTHIL